MESANENRSWSSQRSCFLARGWTTGYLPRLQSFQHLARLGKREEITIRESKSSDNVQTCVNSIFFLIQDYKAKLSDFGLAKDGPLGDETHVSTRVMGTQGYAAPEYIKTGHLSAKSDVFSFGVVLLELLTGRRSVDKNRSGREESLVEWAKPHLRDHRRINRIIDPCLFDGNYSTKAAQIAASLAYQCLSNRPKSRPHISTVVSTLESIQDLHVDIQEPVIVYVAAEDGNMLLKETKKEDQIKVVEPTETNTNTVIKNNNRHCHKRRGGRYMKSISYSDTALYRNCPRHRRNGMTWMNDSSHFLSFPSFLCNCVERQNQTNIWRMRKTV